MTTSVLNAIIASLDLIVFERLPEGGFLRIAPAQLPAWFSRLSRQAAEHEQVSLAQAFPFLERFLVEAEDVWKEEERDRRLRSEPFMATDPAGGDVAVVASALALGARRFLILERPVEFEERRATLQRARQQALEHEAHVRRTGALRPAIDELQRLLDRIEASGVAPGQRQLVTEARDRLSGLAAALDELAPLPKGVKRRPSGSRPLT